MFKILILSNRAFVTRKGAKRVEAELCVKMHPLGAAEENGLIPLRGEGVGHLDNEPPPTRWPRRASAVWPQAM